MSRGHYRSACFGGSTAPDPLVVAVAEGASAPASVAGGAFPTTPVPDALDDIGELARIDEQLNRLTAQTDLNAPLSDAVTTFMRRVGFDSLNALASASLRPLKSAIARSAEERDPARWASYHVLLGCALRLRAQRMPLHRRTVAMIDAVRAFDIAYYVYATHARQVPSAQSLHLVKTQPVRHRHAQACATESDGSSLIARVMSSPAGTHNHLLQRAAMWLRVSRASADPKSWEWLASSNNLACALTLLGARTPTPAGTGMLREATDVLAEALGAHADGHGAEDRDATLINLAEALLSLAERETPHMRLQRAERALTASSIALLSVAPADFRRLIQLQRLTREQ